MTSSNSRQQSRPGGNPLALKLNEIEPLEDGLAMFHAFANVAVVYGRGAILAVDTSGGPFGRAAVRAIRELTDEPMRVLVYTHGHGDHAFGTRAFVADAEARGDAWPEIWGHALVLERFARYRRTQAWQDAINRAQFAVPPGVPAFPSDYVPPDHTFTERAEIELAGERIELHHARGETDDATWVWLPERRVACVGDLVIWSIPNTGNPNKVQRYTLEWAEALERIAALQPRRVLPGHGAPIEGELALELLSETARALRTIHDAVVERLNAGLWPEEIYESGITLPPDLARRPYLQPLYGCVPFVVRDVLRAYAGWWSGEPAELFPAPRAVRANDLVSIAGRDALLRRARELLAAGEAQRALHLAGHLVAALPEDREAAAVLAGCLEARASAESSFIGRNLLERAAEKARARAGTPWA